MKKERNQYESYHIMLRLNVTLSGFFGRRWTGGNWVTLTNDSHGTAPTEVAGIWPLRMFECHSSAWEQVCARATGCSSWLIRSQVYSFPRLLWVLHSQAGSMPGVPQGSLFSPSKNGREGSANAVFKIYQTILTSRVSHHSFFFSKEMKVFQTIKHHNEF